jgi:hypothetical protein
MLVYNGLYLQDMLPFSRPTSPWTVSTSQLPETSANFSFPGAAAFPWDNLPKDSVVVDVAGGVGSASLILARAHPHLQFVIEDQAQVVSHGNQVKWRLNQCRIITGSLIVSACASRFGSESSLR